MGKIDNDKYYTPINIANRCWDRALQYIGAENITETIEPSVGNGAFLQHTRGKVQIAYDILPECFSDMTDILQQDFLTADIPYKHGRLIIGNPPYGARMHKAQQFYRKSVEIADYIAFILTISQLNNTQTLSAFDLIYSEDLGIQQYTDRELHCCFNVYKRPVNGLHGKTACKLKDVTIIRQDSRKYADSPCDLRMCYWGDGSAGKILKPSEHYAAEYKIIVNNTVLRQQVIDCLSTYNWQKYLTCIAARKIQQYHIYDVLRQEIPGIS